MAYPDWPVRRCSTCQCIYVADPRYKGQCPKCGDPSEMYGEENG